MDRHVVAPLHLGAVHAFCTRFATAATEANVRADRAAAAVRPAAAVVIAVVRAAADLQALCVDEEWRFCFIGGLAVLSRVLDFLGKH
jgi:hypothetical protein